MRATTILLELCVLALFVPTTNAQDCSPTVFLVDGWVHTAWQDNDGTTAIERLADLVSSFPRTKSILLEKARVVASADEVEATINGVVNDVAGSPPLVVFHYAAFSQYPKDPEKKRVRQFLEGLQAKQAFAIVFGRKQVQLPDERFRAQVLKSTGADSYWASHLVAVGNEMGVARWGEKDDIAVASLTSILQAFATTCSLTAEHSVATAPGTLAEPEEPASTLSRPIRLPFDLGEIFVQPRPGLHP